MKIYKITSLINSKVYIGQTIAKISSRKGLHLFHLRNNKHPNRYLQNSYNKYGEDNFIFEIIDEAESIDELNIKEVFYIKEYDSCNREKGYNIRTGGLNEALSEEHKIAISKALIGNTNGAGGKGKSKFHPKGLVHTDETKQLISSKLKGRTDYNKESIEKARKSRLVKVIQYNLDGIYVNEFDSILEASQKTGANKSLISLCLSGKKNTANGFKWGRKPIMFKLVKIFENDKNDS